MSNFKVCQKCRRYHVSEITCAQLAAEIAARVEPKTKTETKFQYGSWFRWMTES
jgi:hypothetical protein